MTTGSATDAVFTAELMSTAELVLTEGQRVCSCRERQRENVIG